jgi:DNA-binding transcriptional ArsR family regulator
MEIVVASVTRWYGEEAIRVYLPKEPRREEFELSSVLYALGDEIRMDIVRQLARGAERACGDFRIEKPKSSLSHHFRVLRESGIVTTRRVGTMLLNSLRRDDLESRFPGLLKAVLGATGGARRARTGRRS